MAIRLQPREASASRGAANLSNSHTRQGGNRFWSVCFRAEARASDGIRARSGTRTKPLLQRLWSVASLALHFSISSQGERCLGAVLVYRRATLRIPPIGAVTHRLGAQHPSGGPPPLFHHVQEPEAQLTHWCRVSCSVHPTYSKGGRDGSLLALCHKRKSVCYPLCAHNRRSPCLTLRPKTDVLSGSTLRRSGPFFELLRGH